MLARLPTTTGALVLLAVVSGSCGSKEGFRTESDGGQVGFGEYQDGQRHGVWSFLYRTTKSLAAIGSYEEGLKDGQWTYYYPDKSMGEPDTHVRACGCYVQGKRDGEWKFWHENGTVDLKRTGVYLDGDYIKPLESAYTALYPSKQAVAVLAEIGLRDGDVVSFVDRDGVFGGGHWFISARAMAEGALCLLLSRSRSPESEAEVLTVCTDGDVADLYYRIKGKRHDSMKGRLSSEYRAFLERKGR